jgi:hypothetical protein
MPWLLGSVLYTGAKKLHLNKKKVRKLIKIVVHVDQARNNIGWGYCVDLEWLCWHDADNWSSWVNPRGACRTTPVGGPASPPPRSCSTSPWPSILLKNKQEFLPSKWAWQSREMCPQRTEGIHDHLLRTPSHCFLSSETSCGRRMRDKPTKHHSAILCAGCSWQSSG